MSSNTARLFGKNENTTRTSYIDRETPLFAQLARQLVGSEPGIVRVNGEDFHPPPELLFQILPSLDSLLKGALKGRTESDLRHHAANDFFKSPMELENLSLPRFTSSRLRRWFDWISPRRSSMSARSSKNLSSSFSSTERFRTSSTKVSKLGLMWEIWRCEPCLPMQNAPEADEILAEATRRDAEQA